MCHGVCQSLRERVLLLLMIGSVVFAPLAALDLRRSEMRVVIRARQEVDEIPASLRIVNQALKADLLAIPKLEQTPEFLLRYLDLQAIGTRHDIRWLAQFDERACDMRGPITGSEIAITDPGNLAWLSSTTPGTA